MRGVRFETRQSAFNSIDFRFELDTYVTQNRIVLNPVSVSIPGRDPVYFRPQQGERDLKLSFSYVGENFLNDLDKFVSKLYNSRMPLRIILAREADRYYVAQIVDLPTEDRHRLFSKAEVTAQLLRNYALRRWRDDEITPDNPDINFSMPIVPVQAVHELTGSSAIIPYYNEGIDLPLALELEGVDKPTIIVGDAVAHYSRDIGGKLLIDFEYLKARENGTDRSEYLSGDQVEIPHGSQLIRLHYQRENPVTINAADDTYDQFAAGTATNLIVGLSSDDLPVVKSITHAPPTFTRASVGYNDKGEEVAIDSPRFVDGKDGIMDAIIIEQAVTQELIDADLPNLDNWVDTGITLTGKYMGVAQIARASAANGTRRVYLYQRVTATAGEIITAQVMARRVGPVDHCELRLSFYNGQTFISSTTKQIHAELTENFKLFSVTGTAPANTTEVHCYVCYDGGTQRTNCEVEVVMPMVTRTNRTWGWHKSGTKAPDNMDAPASFFNESEGAINVWIYHDGFVPASGSRHIWETDVKGLGLYYFSDGNYLVRVDGSYLTWMSPPQAVGWCMLTVKWVGNQISLYRNGAFIRSATAPSPITFAGAAALRIGRERNGTQYWNGLIDDLRIFDEALSDQEVADLYAAGPGAPPNEKTVYHLPMNGSVTAKSGGLFVSREHSISTKNKPVKGVLTFDQDDGGSVEFDTRLYLNGQWGDWQPVAYDGRVQGIGPTTNLNGAKIQYRARFVNYDVSDIHELYRVSIAIETERAAKMIIKNRKRLA